MTSITISLTDESVLRLKELAERSGVSPEELVQSGVEQWLSKPKDDFSKAAEFVVNKNAELYDRLAK